MAVTVALAGAVAVLHIMVFSRWKKDGNIEKSIPATKPASQQNVPGSVRRGKTF